MLSQLAHVEVVSPVPDASVKFYTEVLGLQESGRDATSVHLRCWGDWFQHSVVVTEGASASIGHIGWRTSGAEDLALAVERLQASGIEGKWCDEVAGHGRAFRFTGPGGHVQEVFWDVERWQAPPDRSSVLPIRPQRRPTHGTAVRQLDHVTLGTDDPWRDALWYRETLDFRFMEYAVPDEDPDSVVFCEISTNEQAHDMGLLRDDSGMPGRTHHFGFWLDQQVDLLRAADSLIEAQVEIEYGPGMHGHGENAFLYVREPSGLRVELFSGGLRNYQPDWEPARWLLSQGSSDLYGSMPAPDSFSEMAPPDAEKR